MKITSNQVVVIGEAYNKNQDKSFQEGIELTLDTLGIYFETAEKWDNQYINIFYNNEDDAE